MIAGVQLDFMIVDDVTPFVRSVVQRLRSLTSPQRPRTADHPLAIAARLGRTMRPLPAAATDAERRAHAVARARRAARCWSWRRPELDRTRWIAEGWVTK